MAEQDLAALADERLDDWLKRSRQWYALFYTLGALSVVLTITVASRPHFISEDPKTFSDLAWAAAIFQGLNTFLIASRKATAYRAAWRALWVARLRWIGSGQTVESREAVEKAIIGGWSTIDGGYVEGADSAKSKQKSRRAAPRSTTNKRPAKRR